MPAAARRRSRAARPGRSPTGTAPSHRRRASCRRAARAAAPAGTRTSCASVTDGNAPTMVTNTTARSVGPNQITASGSHAIERRDLQGHDERPDDRRANSLSASPTPSAVPTDDRDGEGEREPDQGLRGRLRDRAVAETVAANGATRRGARAAVDESTRAATRIHTSSSPPMPASGGPSSLPTASRATTSSSTSLHEHARGSRRPRAGPGRRRGRADAARRSAPPPTGGPARASSRSRGRRAERPRARCA